MSDTQRRIMHSLYGRDVWHDFHPQRPPEPAVHGWNGDHPSLARLAGASGAHIVIDVGVWKGQSTITMAAAMKRLQLDGCVIAIDTFLGSLEHWDAGLYTRTHGLPDLYQTFLENVYYNDVTEYVVPLPQTATTAAFILQERCISAAVVHIDAAHEYSDVMRDAEGYWQILSAGGYLIGDDYHETWPDVVRAAGEFSARVCRPLTIDPPKWILQKT